MSEYREESVRRRDVRAGIGLENEKAVRGNKTVVPRDWLTVYFWRKHDRYGFKSDSAWPQQIAIHGEYRKEEEARTVVMKKGVIHCYFGPEFYCHRSVFEAIKKALQ